MKPNVVLSTIGTSLLTNEAGPGLRDLLICNANKNKSDIDCNSLKDIDSWFEERAEKIKDADDNTVSALSAEANGLLTWYRSNSVTMSRSDQHYLVHTDTYLGNLAARMVADWIKRKSESQPICLSPSGLNMDNLENFRSALANLAKEFDEHKLQKWRDDGYHVAFNLTGGFKSVNGFVQTLGLIFADECFYLFEGSRDLMRVPRLPLRLDAANEIRSNLETVRKMANGTSAPTADCETLSDALLFEVDGQCILSEWGNVLWLAEKNNIYSEGLQPSLSENMCFSNRFENQVSNGYGLCKEEKYILDLNRCLDALSAFLDQGNRGGKFMGSLELKLLKGNPKTSSITHEFYLWSGKGECGFGYFDDNDIFVVDHIGSHL